MVLALKVDGLPADHAIRSGRCADGICGLDFSCFRMFDAIGQHDLISLVRKGVSGQHGDSFSENLMVGESSPSVIIIVHAWQVVMDQREGVYHFQCAGIRHQFIRRYAEKVADRQAKNRTYPLPPARRLYRDASMIVFCSALVEGR